MRGHGPESGFWAYVVRPGDGRQIEIPGMPEVATILAAAVNTGGRVSIFETWHGPDDRGVPRHRHRHLDEMFYVLDGEMRFLVGTEEVVAGPGTFVCVPRGTVHAWRPTGTGPARALSVVVPGGFEGYLEEMRTLPPPQTAPEAWQEFQRRWDVEIVGPPLEDGD